MSRHERHQRELRWPTFSSPTSIKTKTNRLLVSIARCLPGCASSYLAFTPVATGNFRRSSRTNIILLHSLGCRQSVNCTAPLLPGCRFLFQSPQTHNNKNKFVDSSFNTMCNPNSSIANRRFRSASFQKGGTTSLLTQRLMGSLMSVTPTLGTSKKDIPKLEYRDYSVSATKVVRDDDPFELEFSTSLDGLNGSNGFADRVPYSYSAISGYLEEPSTEDHLQQSGFEASSVPPLVGRKTKAKRKRKPQQPGLTAKVRRPFKP